MSQLHLMRTLNFNTEDLRANREGRMSEAQRERLTPPKTNPMIAVAVFGHLAVVGGMLALLAIFTQSMALWAVFGLAVVMMMAPFGFLRSEGKLNRPVMRDDMAKGRVEKACGIVILTEKKGRKTTFDLLVSGISLEISPAEAAAFQHEAMYCVYYLPGSKTLLSAELAH